MRRLLELRIALTGAAWAAGELVEGDRGMKDEDWKTCASPSGDDAGGLWAIGAVAAWCKASQNGMPLVQGLRLVADALKAELAVVTRVSHDREGPLRKSLQVLSFDRRANFSRGAEPYRHSSAEVVCGRYLAVSKPGTIWNARVSELETASQVVTALRQRKLIESVVIPLEHHVNCSDFLELHFARDLGARELDRIGLIGTTLADAWKTRQMGLMSKNVFRQPVKPQRDEEETTRDVLALENPCKLSRAEYRVCLLLSSGLNNRAMLKELSIGAATLRTHLRNIYAKTGAATQCELLQMLLLRPSRHRDAVAYSVQHHNVA